ncbi:DUF2061 domain-containing protein [Parvularcula marina]|uniref:DUF2061 domain-containing protein n=1 Tax=Parvularcula marina TaxID=2292771 RepID=A0A371R813_9PROT|nr:DUF2061 domain-containing protein [Parvularcula marina]RFB01596.1 DUF2061 domain-containing protein [Parvularcula marina]
MSVTALKPLTYGAMHFIVAIGVAYALTGSWAVALGIGMVEPLIQTFAYTLHEKLWAKAGAAPRPHYHHHAPMPHQSETA